MLTAPVSFDLNYRRCASFGGWLSHKALQSVCKRIWRFFPHFPPQLINEQASPLSAPIYQVKGYQASCMYETEHICTVAPLIWGFNSSIRFLTTHSSDWKRKESTLKKPTQCLNILAPVCAITAEAQSGLQPLSHFSGYMFADIETERHAACYRVAADKASRKRCVHHFTEGWNKMVSHCHPAGKCRSHQSKKKRKKGPSRKKKKRILYILKKKKRLCYASLASSSCLTLMLAAALLSLPVCRFTLLFSPSVNSSFLIYILCCWAAAAAAAVRARSSRAPLFSLAFCINDTQQIWGLSLIKQDTAASPRTAVNSLCLSFAYSCSSSVYCSQTV